MMFKDSNVLNVYKVLFSGIDSRCAKTTGKAYRSIKNELK